jgi:hypothetical protein
LSPFLFGLVFPAICLFFLGCEGTRQAGFFTFCRMEYSLII